MYIIIGVVISVLSFYLGRWDALRYHEEEDFPEISLKTSKSKNKVDIFSPSKRSEKQKFLNDLTK